MRVLKQNSEEAKQKCKIEEALKLIDNLTFKDCWLIYLNMPFTPTAELYADWFGTDYLHGLLENQKEEGLEGFEEEFAEKVKEICREHIEDLAVLILRIKSEERV